MINCSHLKGPTFTKFSPFFFPFNSLTDKFCIKTLTIQDEFVFGFKENRRSYYLMKENILTRHIVSTWNNLGSERRHVGLGLRSNFVTAY